MITTEDDWPWLTFKPKPEYDIELLRPAIYDERNRNKGFETIADAIRENAARAEILRSGTSAASLELANDIGRCSPRRWCLSTACKWCMRNFRRAITGLALETLEDEESVRMITIVLGEPYRSDWLRGNAPIPCLKAIKRKLRNDFARHAPFIHLAIGGIEVDLDAETKLAEPHLHVVTIVNRVSRLDDLREFYRRSTGLDRALLVSDIVPFDQRAKCVSYLWKFSPTRKLSFKYTNKNGVIEATTKKRRLKGPAGRRAYHWLDKYRPEDFIFTIGCPLRNGKLIRADGYAGAD